MSSRISLARHLPPWLALRVAPLDLLFAFVVFLALRALLVQGLEPLGPFDEGLLFADAQLMADGRVPYRDFYALYPPGAFQPVRLMLALSDSPIWMMRCLTFLVRAATAAAVGWMVARAGGRSFCLASASAVLVLQSKLGLVAYAYTYAVLLVLFIAASWPKSDAPAWRTLASGALFAGLSYLRHDMFVYVMAQLGALELGWFLLKRRWFVFTSTRQLLQFAGAVALVFLLLWGPTLVQAGVSQPLHDLLLDLGDVMKARTLPVPPLSDKIWSGAFNMLIPALVGERVRLLLVLSALSVCAAAFLMVQELRSPDARAGTRARLALLCIFMLTTLPQALQRTDYWHAAFGIPLAFAAGLPALRRGGAQVLALVSLLPWFGEGVSFISGADALRLWQANDSMFLTPERAYTVSYVREHTKPDEPIFVCCSDHRRLIINPLDVYYWAHRPGATRYMQFDPGLVTKQVKQEEMIADLERTKPRLVLRSPTCYWTEPNESTREGATALDDYLSRKFAFERQLGDFQLWLRK